MVRFCIQHLRKEYPQHAPICEKPREIFHIEEMHTFLFQFRLNLCFNLFCRSYSTSMEYFDPVVRRMSTADQKDLIPPGQSGVARRAYGEIGLESDHDDLCIIRNDVVQPRARKGVVLHFVDEKFVFEWGEDELPTWCTWLVWVTYVACI